MVLAANWRWNEREVSGGDAVVFDIDGVICNADARQHFLEKPKKDWRGFFGACGNDELIEETSRLISVLTPDVAVVLLTGRPLDVRDITVDWLRRHDIRWNLLIMRERGDYAASLSFKRQTLRRLKADGFNLVMGFEDDTRNQAMFVEEGVPCMYVHSGYYETRDQKA